MRRHPKRPDRFTRSAVAAMLAALAFAALPGGAHAQPHCAARTSVQLGETAEAVARRCGVNVEALRALNPGLDPKRPPLGAIVTAPRPALPSAAIQFGGNPALSMPRIGR